MWLLNDDTPVAISTYSVFDMPRLFIVTLFYINMRHWICMMVVL